MTRTDHDLLINRRHRATPDGRRTSGLRGESLSIYLGISPGVLRVPNDLRIRGLVNDVHEYVCVNNPAVIDTERRDYMSSGMVGGGR